MRQNRHAQKQTIHNHNDIAKIKMIDICNNPIQISIEKIAANSIQTYNLAYPNEFHKESSQRNFKHKHFKLQSKQLNSIYTQTSTVTCSVATNADFVNEENLKIKHDLAKALKELAAKNSVIRRLTLENAQLRRNLQHSLPNKRKHSLLLSKKKRYSDVGVTRPLYQSFKVAVTDRPKDNISFSPLTINHPYPLCTDGIIIDEDKDHFNHLESKLSQLMWRELDVASCRRNPRKEDLRIAIYEEKHRKFESEEMQRKKWDIQRLKRQNLKKSENEELLNEEPILTQHVSHIDEVVLDENVHVYAFGAPLPQISQQPFSLPSFNISQYAKHLEK